MLYAELKNRLNKIGIKYSFTGKYWSYFTDNERCLIVCELRYDNNGNVYLDNMRSCCLCSTNPDIESILSTNDIKYRIKHCSYDMNILNIAKVDLPLKDSTYYNDYDYILEVLKDALSISQAEVTRKSITAMLKEFFYVENNNSKDIITQLADMGSFVNTDGFSGHLYNYLLYGRSVIDFRNMIVDFPYYVGRVLNYYKIDNETKVLIHRWMCRCYQDYNTIKNLFEAYSINYVFSTEDDSIHIHTDDRSIVVIVCTNDNQVQGMTVSILTDTSIYRIVDTLDVYRDYKKCVYSISGKQMTGRYNFQEEKSLLDDNLKSRIKIVDVWNIRDNFHVLNNMIEMQRKHNVTIDDSDFDINLINHMIKFIDTDGDVFESRNIRPQQINLIRRNAQSSRILKAYCEYDTSKQR